MIWNVYTVRTMGRTARGHILQEWMGTHVRVWTRVHWCLCMITCRSACICRCACCMGMCACARCRYKD